MNNQVFKKFLDQELNFLEKLWKKIEQYNMQDDQITLDFLDALNKYSIRR